MRPSIRHMTLFVLSTLLASLVPSSPIGIPAITALAAPHTQSSLPPPPVVVTVPPFQPIHSPSLALVITVAPSPVPLGATATIAITLTNASPDAASNVQLALAVPADTVPVPGSGFVDATTGWRWNVGAMAGQARTAVTAQVQVLQLPQSGALLASAQATSAETPDPVHDARGALVVDPANGVGTAPFAPGAATTLRSPDGAIEVALPTDAAAQPLALRLIAPGVPVVAAPAVAPTPVATIVAPSVASNGVRGDGSAAGSAAPAALVATAATAVSTPVATPIATATPPSGGPPAPIVLPPGELVPPADAGFKHGFGTFFLQATDASGAAVHQFAKPLNVRLHYTPAQLGALGISEADLAVFWFDPATTRWVALATDVDPATQIARVQVDHFSAFQLSDGSSPSAAFIPSLQGFQTSLYTGAASYSYPIDVPAGPAGLKPSLALSYSSAATDGATGLRWLSQAGWAGKGWSLDTGSIARQTQVINEGTAAIASYFSLVVNGASYTLMGEGSACDIPTSCTWHPTDESYIRVQPYTMAQVGGRGGSVGGTPQTRYGWQVWTKDGTRYDFEEDLWWGWCNVQKASFEQYKWLLTRAVDPSGNVITYTYNRATHVGQTRTCGPGNAAVQGSADVDAWPTQISWGRNQNVSGSGDHFIVEFWSSPRPYDTSFDQASTQYDYNGDGVPRETRRLDALKVIRVNGAWTLLREYRLGFADSTTATKPDNPSCGGSCNLFTKLTLLSITPVASDGTTAWPATAFSYKPMTSTNNVPDGGANRINSVDNGWGATLTIAYQNVHDVNATPAFANTHRVTQRQLVVGAGKPYAATYRWIYSYGTPRSNTIDTSATIYWNEKSDPNNPTAYHSQLVQQPLKEFRGHDWVNVDAATLVSGNWRDDGRTKHEFFQGEKTETGSCAPTVTGLNLRSDTCFKLFRDHEFLKGHEYKTTTRATASDTAALLQQTEQFFSVSFLGYGDSNTLNAGLWRAWNAEWKREERQFEGGSTASTKTTISCYALNKQGGAQFGNRTHLLEYDHDAAIDSPPGNCEATSGLDSPVRITRQDFKSYQTAASYIVDRPVQDVVMNGSAQLQALTERFYDNQNTYGDLTGKGQLSLVRVYRDVNAGATLQSSDTRYRYDNYGNRDAETTFSDWGTRTTSGSTTTWSDRSGNLNGRTTTTFYDSATNSLPVEVWQYNGLMDAASYDAHGWLITTTDPNNAVTSATYDVFGRMASLIKPLDSVSGPTVSFAYADWERPARTTTGLRGGVWNGDYQERAFFFDGLGRKVETKHESLDSTQNIVREWRYGANGQTARESLPRYVSETNSTFWYYTNPASDAAMRWTTTTYDTLDRPLLVTEPDTTTTRHLYGVWQDPLVGNSWLRYHDTVDANRHRTQWRSDSLGRLRTVYELRGDCGTVYAGYGCGGSYTTSWATDSSTLYSYDPRDQLMHVRDDAGNTTSISYDSAGRKTKQIDPDLSTWQSSYNATGTLNTQTDGRGIVAAYGYDVIDRVTAISYSDGTPSVYYGYDESTSSNSKGRRSATCTGDNSGGCKVYQNWQYDTRGRVASTSFSIDGTQDTLGYSYDSADRAQTISYPSGRVLRYAYDAAGRPQTACIDGQTPCLVTNTTYSELDQPLVTNLGNGVSETRSYTLERMRLQSLQVGSFVARSYGYDLVGNITAITDTRLGQTQNFGYDHRDRLVQAWTSGSSSNSYNESYSYNAIGNLTSKAGLSYSYPNGGSARPHSPTSVGGASYSYDGNGNVTAGAGRTLGWNGRNQLDHVTGSDGVTEYYLYDADGERAVRARVGGVNVHYVAGLVEVDGSGTRTELYPFGGTTIAEQVGTGAVTYLHGDHLGSVSVATTQSGALASPVTEYTPWGALRTGGIAQTTLSYTGQRRDDTGLLYYHARYYDPTLGRFVSPDSVVPGADALNATAGGKGAGPANPQQLNRYSYVANNPVNRTDPTGHAPCAPQPGTQQGNCNEGAGGGSGGEPVGGTQGASPAMEAAEAEATEMAAAEAEATLPNGAGAANNGTTERPADSPYYEAGYRAKLQQGTDYPGVSAQRHFALANKQLHDAMKADEELGEIMEKAYPGIKEGVEPGTRGAFPRRPPTSDLTWHHHPTEEGVLELVPRSHHSAPGPVQAVLHPDGRGGMEIWGGGR